jgi:large repetitive protein
MFRSFIRFLSRCCSPSRPASKVKKRRRVPLQLETLENRWVPAMIGGYVYADLTDTGLMGPNDPGIAGQQIQLQDSAGNLIASTTTDSNGHYQFADNPNINTQPQAINQNLQFVNPTTGETKTDTFNQFDPSLGTLTSVDILVNGTLTSDIKIENTDGSSGQVNASVSGNITMSGIPGTTNPVVTTLNGTPQQTTIAPDGTVDFGAQTVSGSQTITLDATQQDLSAYIGTGTISVTEQANSTSSATGPGNIVDTIASNGGATVQIVYHYTPTNGLPPGTYKVVEVQTPPGYLDGQLTNNNVTPIPNSVGQHEIDVQLTNNNSPNNDFAAVPPSSLSGFVYYDVNDNGVKDPTEPGIAGSTIQLTGTNDLNQTVDEVFTTQADGSYLFSNLRPGTYQLTDMTQPAGYQEGTDTIGSQGGTVSQDVFSAIQLTPGTTGINNDFGKIKTASLSGEVYSDLNNNGVIDQGEPGIGGVTIELSGTTTTGQAVQQTQQTANDGTYSFAGLLPGTYALTKLNTPAGYTDGKDTIGTQGGTVGPNSFSQIQVTGDTNGINNNFGELKQGELSGHVYDDSNNNGVKDPGEAGIDNVSVQLTGTTLTGQAVNLTQKTTGPDGVYDFTGLQAGTYTLTKLNTPAGYIDGKDTIGTQGGVTGTDSFTQITLNPGQTGSNNDFGMYKGSSLSGYVYVDPNNTGIMQAGSGLKNVQITLTGTDMNNNPVLETTTTDANGFYQFAGLLAGDYTITKTPPVGYIDGQQNLGTINGTPAGTQGPDQFFVNLALENQGINYNFAEVPPPNIAPNGPPPIPIPEPITPAIPGKYWLSS